MQLARALAKNRFNVGCRVKVRGTPNLGSVTHVYDTMEDIEWAHKLPHFIRVQLDAGPARLYNPSQLKGTTKEKPNV